MKFNVKDWLEIYHEVKRLGKRLRDSKRTWDNENKKWIPADYPMPKIEQKALKEWIENLLLQNNLYLDSCGINPRKPLWKYLESDPKTWASHEDFIYGHLIKVEEVV